MTIKWIAVFAALMVATPLIAADATALKTEKEKRSYSVGVDMATNFKRLDMDLDIDALIKGLKDGFGGGKLLMSEDDVRATLGAYNTEVKQKQVDAMKKVAEDNKKQGEVFLSENAKKEGVTALPSGLQYKVIKMGEGKKPSDTDTVEVHYRGTLINGTEFDSSYSRGQTATFPVKGVIPGWTEALKLMPVGSMWQLFLPPQLAYGERGAGRDIGPNATLIFEVELIAIK